MTVIHRDANSHPKNPTTELYRSRFFGYSREISPRIGIEPRSSLNIQNIASLLSPSLSLSLVLFLYIFSRKDITDAV